VVDGERRGICVIELGSRYNPVAFTKDVYMYMLVDLLQW